MKMKCKKIITIMKMMANILKMKNMKMNMMKYMDNIMVNMKTSIILKDKNNKNQKNHNNHNNNKINNRICKDI